jgi:hypothetical protein
VDVTTPALGSNCASARTLDAPVIEITPDAPIVPCLSGGPRCPINERWFEHRVGSLIVMPDPFFSTAIRCTEGRASRTREVCAQCLASRPDEPPTVAVTARNGETVYVHERGCLKFWKRDHGNGACP